MPVDISGLLINSAVGFGLGVLLYEFKKRFIDEDFSSTDSSFVYSIEEEEVKKGEGKSDDNPRVVTRILKVQKKN